MNSPGNQIKQQMFLPLPQSDPPRDNITSLKILIAGKQFPVTVNNPELHPKRSSPENEHGIHLHQHCTGPKTA